MRSNIMALQQRRADLAKKCRSMLDTASIQNRDLNTEEAALYERTMGTIRETDARIIEAQALIDEEMKGPALPDENALFSHAAGSHVPNAGGVGFDQGHGFRPKKGAKLYRDLFGPQLSSGGFRNANDFYRAFHLSDKLADPRLLAAANVEDTPSLGGFAVPEEMAAQILDRALDSEVVRKRATIYRMNSETLKVPGLDNFDHSASLYGGFSATWTGENQLLTPQTNKLWQLGLTANALKILGQISNELLSDAVSGYESAYQASLIAAVSWFNDFAFLQGSGAGRPLGVLNNPALIVVPAETSPAQAAGSIVYENITRMFSRLHPACLSNAVWVCNSTAIPQLLAMQNKVWNNAHTDVVGGSAVPIVSQNADGSFSMLTRELLFTEKLPPLGAQGDILLADFSQYVIGQRQGMGIEKSSHAGFLTDTSYYRIITRLDGQGSWKSAMTPKNGDSLSWCVTLAAR